MARIPDDVRAAVEADLRDGTLSHRQIATKHDISPASVSNIGKAADIDCGERPGLENARRAQVADYQERRARIRAQLAKDAEEEQSRLWAPITIGKFGGKGNTWSEVDLDEPPPDVRRDIWINIAVGIDKMAVMDRAEVGTSEAAGLVEQLVSSIRARRQERAEAS